MELLVCISIIAIVFAITAPVFQYARESARITSAVSYMHQIGKAIAIYRSDWEEGGGYTTAHQLGLPTYEYVRDTALGLSSPPLASPCGYRAGIGFDNSRHAPDYVWTYSLTDTEWWQRRILEKYRENTLLVFDPRCNPSGTDWNSPYAEKRAIGLLLSGQVINRRKAGLADHQDWWAPPAP